MGPDRDLHTSWPRRDTALRHRLGQHCRVFRHSDHIDDFLSHRWPEPVAIIAGLIIGGVIAAPFAAMATKHIPDKILMLLVGCVVVLLSLRTILMALAPGP
jgi:hypothetical protein